MGGRHSPISMVVILAVVFAAVVAVGSFIGVYTQGRLPSDAELTDQLEQGLVETFGAKAHGLLAEEFPQEYADLVAAVLASAKDDPGNLDAAFSIGQDMSKVLILQSGDAALRAPLDNLRAHLAAYRHMIDGMSDAPEVCGNIAYNGGADVSREDLQRFDPSIYLPQFASTLELIVLGREAGLDHATPGPTDIGITFDDWMAHTDLPPATVDAFQAEDWRHPGFCPAWSDYLAYVEGRSDAVGARAVVFWVAALLGLPMET